MELQANRTYLLKTELKEILNIPTNQIERRQDELLEWFKNFFDYEFYNTKPLQIRINEIYGNYEPLPRKKYTSTLRAAELAAAEKDYADFTIQSLSTKDYEPNSKMRIARNAINTFGSGKYHHSGYQYVANRFIKEPFDQNAESNNKQVWVFYNTYQPIDEAALAEWRRFLQEEHIGEREAAKAFYKAAQGQNIDKEKNYYQRAVDRFKSKYNDIPVLVSCYKLKDESAY